MGREQGKLVCLEVTHLMGVTIKVQCVHITVTNVPQHTHTQVTSLTVYLFVSEGLALNTIDIFVLRTLIVFVKTRLDLHLTCCNDKCLNVFGMGCEMFAAGVMKLKLKSVALKLLKLG